MDALVPNRITVGLLSPAEVTRAGLAATLAGFPDLDLILSTDPDRGAAPLTDPLPHVLIVNQDDQDVLVADTASLIIAARSTNLLILAKRVDAGLLRQILKAGVKGVVLETDPKDLLAPAIRAVAKGQVFLTPSLSDVVCDLVLAGGHPPLTKREQHILSLVADGLSSKRIADELGISVRTVEVHRLNLMRKLGVHSSTELVRYAIRHGLVLP